MIHKILLEPDENNTVIEIEDRIYTPQFLSEVILSYLRENASQLEQYLLRNHTVKLSKSILKESPSRVLQPHKGWISGQVSLNICLVFHPDPEADSNPQESPPLETSISLDDIRQHKLDHQLNS